MGPSSHDRDDEHGGRVTTASSDLHETPYENQASPPLEAPPVTPSHQPEHPQQLLPQQSLPDIHQPSPGTHGPKPQQPPPVIREPSSEAHEPPTGTPEIQEKLTSAMTAPEASDLTLVVDDTDCDRASEQHDFDATPDGKDLEKADADAVGPAPRRHESPDFESSSGDFTALSLDDVQPVDVQLRGLGVGVDTSPSWLEPATYGQLFRDGFRRRPATKTLLRDVSASLAPGSLTAIIGGSGSGKTTLLNTLAERTTSARLSRTGTATFNGAAGVGAMRSAYVMQQDVLLPALTVRETLQYAARLRLPEGVSEAAMARVVDEVVLELGLKECADTRVGSGRHKGCSGGEKRRTSIGVQMLSNPSVLFLDEPTTGLDSTSAHHLVRTLKNLAQRGRTVVATIHQPRSEIWQLFDNVVVLSRGRPVYSGPLDGCAPWFAERGHALPEFVNPAEFFVDVAAVDTRTPEREAESAARVEAMQDAWVGESERRHPQVPPPPEASKKTTRRRRRRPRHHAPFLRQLRVLTERTLKTTYRDPLGMLAALVEAAAMAVVAGYIFYDLGRDQSGIRSRQGALYIVAGLQGYLVLVLEVFRLTEDVRTYDREHGEGCVGAPAFVLARRLARLPTEDVPAPLVFAAIFYLMAGLERTAERFFVFFAITLLTHYTAVACALACVAAARSFAGASLIANLVFTLQSMACGMFIQSNSIPVYVRWLKHVTYTYYGFGAYCANEFQGNFYDCPAPGGPSDPACAPYSGEYVMRALGLPRNWIARPMAAMAGFVVGFLLLATVGLGLSRVDVAMARPRAAAEADLSAGKEALARSGERATRRVDVGLDGFSLDLDAKGWPRWVRPWTMTTPTTTTKRILHPVTTTFHAGELSVIMGPSGSGKTSLLNAMALRLRGRYRRGGRLTLNGAEPAPGVLRAVCSYVCQDDDGLLPSLTVRETLVFAAGLRLPAAMGAAEKRARAEEVLLRMGLKDCADTVVGGELVKGISGGEKRRVSIAVQVLTDPQVLLLDEPTSGLDAFTAGSIMKVLAGLAAEGRTVVVTIHQARSDLFRNYFGGVLLLARGGQPAYAGRAANLRAHFETLGHVCPRQANPADFALDLVTVDLREQGREDASREVVKQIVAAWAGEEGQQEEAGNTQKKERSRSPPTHHHHHPATPTVDSPARLGALARAPAPLGTTLPLLVRRAVINTRRQPDIILARLMQVLGLALVLLLFFAPLPSDNVAGVQNRMGLIQQVGSLYFVGMLQNVAAYPAERDVFYREHDDGVYGPGAFLATYTLLEVPFEVVSGLGFSALAAMAVGVPRTADVFFVTAFAAFAIVSCGESLGIAFNTLFSDHTGFAMSVTSVILSVATCMSGVLSTKMPALLDALNNLSPARWATHAVAPYMLAPVVFRCDGSAAACPPGLSTGSDVLRLYRFGDEAGWKSVLALGVCVVVHRLAAAAVLVAARWKRRA